MATVTFRIVNVPGVGDRPLPVPPIPVMFLGDTVSYTSPDGALTLTFTRTGPPPLPVPPANSPFTSGETVITDAAPRTLGAAGRFHCACQITKPDGTVVQWLQGENSKGGGDHDVRPPGAPD